MHCHLEIHTTWGLKMAFLVDNGKGPNESLIPPPNVHVVMCSCACVEGMLRSLVFRDVHLADSRCKVSRRHHQMASNGTVYDMSVDPVTEVVVTVGQDKKINMFDISSGKLVRSFKQNKDLGDPIKVTMDTRGSYIVGGDGCIFVWKLPSRLASRMLQKGKEKSLLLSPRALYMPLAFTRTRISGEENKSCSSKISSVAQRCSQHKQRANCHGWDSQETYAFRLSVSRLPKWAQDKVRSTDFVRRNLDITSPQQMQVDPKISSPLISSGGNYGLLSYEHQTASDRCSGASNSCPSDICSSSSNATTETQSSASPDKLVRSAAEDHWFIVYNVHLDLLNSPEVQNLEDVKMPVSSPKLVQGLAEMPRETSQEEVPDVIEQFYYDKTEQSAMDVNAFYVKSEESDLFKEHFGNLSATLEVEKTQSSTRRRRSVNKDEDEDRYSRANDVGRSNSESWPELRGGNPKSLRSNSSVSWRSLSSLGRPFVGERKNCVESNGHCKKRDEFALERNRSARYSPNNIDNGLLRFYLTPMRGSRRCESGKSNASQHSIARSLPRLY
ncbi:Phosphate transporter 4,2 [Hibiscus syriacus]|uniref:Phosphate transporter 4,2 n=1 Tax=Hibiscus syriacus TaxID=106335 RepID=A0A6A3BK89_HIBSY|nr:Phosphate transporter 4,2 [Hibiscus syriacus]